jgi:hypothetical protein
VIPAAIADVRRCCAESFAALAFPPFLAKLGGWRRFGLAIFDLAGSDSGDHDSRADQIGGTLFTSGALNFQKSRISAKRLTARITRLQTTDVQAAVLPLNSTLYLPRLKAAIASINTRIVFRGIFTGAPLSNPQRSLESCWISPAASSISIRVGEMGPGLHDEVLSE